ncbi:amine oxidase [Plakobranchus ocellatus]|uniref:Amine oxidase n=1 Tax=Plakobranchus ocellatus TaxID=259542 RepID=A0AAV3YEW7_9GAST|nr:amine oxidase [Plakobranchus ocellatus]
MSNLSVMAMKEATDLTWSQLRQQRRYLKEAGLLMPSESKQRQAMEDLAADNIVTQMVDFVDSYGQTHRAAFGRVTNITTFVTKLLEQHKLHKTLTWHNSTISHDEVWVKFGGDHGKDSLKFTMQIANTHKPN